MHTTRKCYNSFIFMHFSSCRRRQAADLLRGVCFSRTSLIIFYISLIVVHERTSKSIESERFRPTQVQVFYSWLYQDENWLSFSSAISSSITSSRSQKVEVKTSVSMHEGCFADLFNFHAGAFRISDGDLKVLMLLIGYFAYGLPQLLSCSKIEDSWPCRLK